jgi:hypothetical protein
MSDTLRKYENLRALFDLDAFVGVHVVGDRHGRRYPDQYALYPFLVLVFYVGFHDFALLRVISKCRRLLV